MYVVIVSSCVKVAEKEGKTCAQLHFHGTFDGEIVREVWAECLPPHQPHQGREYIVHLEVDRMESGILHGRVQRLRDLDDILEEF